MHIDILGPIDVRDREGRQLRLPAGRERSLLVLLLLHRGAVVSIDRIVEALWGAQPPETAAKAVQGYVSHLRRVLDAEPGEGEAQDGLIVTRPPGYALHMNGISVDAARFERRASEGRRALEDGEPGEAAAVMDEALELWRGPALIEFEFDDFAQEEIRRLEQLRLAVEEDRVEALLRLGRHADVVGRLESLVGAHPLRERLRGQWMVALYRSGRQADALDAYRDGRRLLADELGLDPAPELQRLERAILGQDEALDAPARPELSRPPPSDVPATSARRRRPLLLLGALLPLAALLGIGAYALVRDREHTAASLPDTPPALVGIDARTNRIVAAVPLGSRPAAVAASPAALWVGDAADGTVTQIDPRSRRVVRTIGIGAPAIDLATDARNLWVATGGFGVVVRIDTGIGAVADRFELGDPADPVVPAVSSIGVSNHRVWVGAFNGIALLDPRTGEITRRVDLGHAPALQLATGGGAVWATLLTRRAKRVDARSMKETAEFYTGTFAFAIARDSSAVWLAGAYGGQLWKFDPVTGATLLTARAGGGADGIALGAGSVWISSSVDHAIVRVDPATGVVLATIPIRGEPEDLLVRDGIVWVTVQTPRGPG